MIFGICYADVIALLVSPCIYVFHPSFGSSFELGLGSEPMVLAKAR